MNAPKDLPSVQEGESRCKHGMLSFLVFDFGVKSSCADCLGLPESVGDIEGSSLASA